MGTSSLTGGWSLSLAGAWTFSTDEAYFIQNYFLLMDPGPAPSLCRFDGLDLECESFSSLCGWFEGNFQSIAGATGGYLYAVGGRIARFDGSAWSYDSTNYAYDVWAYSQNEAFAVSGNGIVFHYTGGSSWPLMTTPVDVDLRGVWGCAPDDVFAVGEDAIVHYDGVVWTEMTVPTIYNLKLMGVWGTATDNVYAVGGHGAEHDNGYQLAAILRYDGTVWSVSYLVIE
jgi:hypothetical protein